MSVVPVLSLPTGKVLNTGSTENRVLPSLFKLGVGGLPCTNPWQMLQWLLLSVKKKVKKKIYIFSRKQTALTENHLKQ